jgi:ABC-type Na+ efflux pump permease subunit
MIRPLADVALLSRAVVVYLLAFAFYGLVTVALGARARDTAAAQNLARPMFIVLLAVFVISLTIVGGANGFGWLIYVPPFTPFMLLLLPTSSLATTLLAVTGLAIAAAAAGCLAARELRIER